MSYQKFKYFSNIYTAQKMNFSIKDFFSKCDQIRRKLRIWLHLFKKSLMGNFIVCAVIIDVCCAQWENKDKNLIYLTFIWQKTISSNIIDFTKFRKSNFE